MTDELPVWFWLPCALGLWGYVVLGITRRVLDARRVLDIEIEADDELLIVRVSAEAWERMTEEERSEFRAIWLGWRRR